MTRRPHRDEAGRWNRLLAAATRSGRPEIPYIQQTSKSDCGIACLAMVLAFHGRRERVDHIRDLAGLGHRGTSADALLTAGKIFNLRGRGVRLETLDQLELLPTASILHWGFNHFVVFENLGPDHAVIVDPAAGRRRVALSEVDRQFTGIALLLEPDSEFQEREAPEHSGARRYWNRVLRYRGLWSRILVLTILLQAFVLSLPFATGLLVDRVIPRTDAHLFWMLSLGLLFMVVFHFLSSWVRAHLLLQLRIRLDHKLTLDFLEHMVDLPFDFFQRRSSGDLMLRLNSNSRIRELLTGSGLSILLDGTLVVVYLAILALAHLGMSLLVLMLGILRLIVYFGTRKQLRELMAAGLSARAQSRGYQVQMLTGLSALKAMGAERRAVDQWGELFVNELNLEIAEGRLSATVNSLLSSLALASPLLILMYGGLQVMRGDLTLGTMLALAALGSAFLVPLGQLVETGLKLQELGGFMERIDDVLETPREQDREAVPAPPLRGEITLDDVTFRYDSDAPPVLRNVSCRIPAGSFVAVVGPSGAGKSTLAALLAGLYPPTDGRILYDGHDLDRLDRRSLRHQLGVVPQEPQLFGFSVRENISLGDNSLAMSQIMDAARRASIHREIRDMPMGYDTLLADGGSSLSGGQRQRLALARALVRDPAVLILDEATSSLDVLVERQVQEELDRLRCTRIVIAHRLSTVAKADLILVMDRGAIVERGTHRQLLALGGAYAALFASTDTHAVAHAG